MRATSKTIREQTADTMLRVGLALCAALLLLLLSGISVGEPATIPVWPETGKKQYKNNNGSVIVDYSFVEQGYIMIKHSGTDKRLKVQIALGKNGDYIELKGDGQFHSFALNKGNGKYSVTVFQNTKAGTDQYSKIFQKNITLKMSDINDAFLFPTSSYVEYDATSKAVAKSMELCAGLTTDKEKTVALYNYVSKNVMYDYIKALTVKKGYVPVVDETLASGMGICFDYSALLACMMRVQGIPTKLVIGNLTAVNPPQYHAWNQAFVEGNWVQMDATFRDVKYKKDDYAPEKYF